jgi:NAD(P)-dependent dehydrogenase (short-subunit alcohol dehydrogenase family)
MNISQTTSPIALITGGSRGLGKSMALHLADAGTDVVITYLANAQAAQEVVAQIQAKGRKAIALPLDVAKASTFSAFAAEVKAALPSLGHQRINYLVNNAGTGAHASFAETTEAQFDTMVNVHLKSTFFLTQQLLPLLRFTFPGYAAYASMKGAVEVLTHYMAKELGARKITVNTLAPGAIETDFGGGAVRDNPQLNQGIAAQTALGRVGLPDDVGGLVALLLSPHSGWLNGQRIEVSGGMLV